MKAILHESFGPPSVLYIGEYLTPIPSENEVLVKVHATALNRADTMQRQGKYPPPPGASNILGLEMSGVVEALGSNCSKAQIGDRVCALLSGGGYAEYVVVHEDMLFHIPDSLSLTDAAGLSEVFLTAYQALVYLSSLQPNETILIHAGASGVGLAATQIAKVIGAKVIVTASSGKHEHCTHAGADHCIDYKEQDFGKEVLKITEKQGVQVILDFLAASYFQKNIDALDFDGRMVMLAAMGGVNIENLNMGKMVWKRLKVMGSTLRARSLEYKIELKNDFQHQFWEHFESGQFKVNIDAVYDWTEVIAAHEKMEANLNAGKIILKLI